MCILDALKRHLNGSKNIERLSEEETSSCSGHSKDENICKENNSYSNKGYNDDEQNGSIRTVSTNCSSCSKCCQEICSCLKNAEDRNHKKSLGLCCHRRKKKNLSRITSSSKIVSFEDEMKENGHFHQNIRDYSLDDINDNKTNKKKLKHQSSKQSIYNTWHADDSKKERAKLRGTSNYSSFLNRNRYKFLREDLQKKIDETLRQKVNEKMPDMVELPNNKIGDNSEANIKSLIAESFTHEDCKAPLTSFPSKISNSSSTESEAER